MSPSAPVGSDQPCSHLSKLRTEVMGFMTGYHNSVLLKDKRQKRIFDIGERFINLKVSVSSPKLSMMMVLFNYNMYATIVYTILYNVICTILGYVQ